MSEETGRVVLSPPPPHLPGGPPPGLLTNRPFLWLVLAEGVFGIALWSYFLAAMGDAAFRFDASPGQLGILLASFSIVFIPSAPAFGALADRWSPQRMLVLGAFGLVGALAPAFFAGSVPWLYLSMAGAGLAEGVVWPARGALVPRLVLKDRLVNANGMIGVVRQIPMILGPALGGIAVSLWGSRALYVIALATLGVALILYAIVPDRRTEGRAEQSFLRDLVVGLRAGVRVPVLRLLFLTGAGVMLVIGLLQTLEPLFVKSVLGRGQAALGFLWSVTGVGAFLASLALIRLRRAAGTEMLIIAVGGLIGGVGFLVYVATGLFAAAILGTALVGAGYILFISTGQALIQRISDAPGKVSAVFVVISEIGPLVAALGVGAMGRLDVQRWLVSAALAFIALSVVVLWAARRPAFLVEGPRTPGAREAVARSP